MINHVEEFREDLKEFDEETDKFYKKEIKLIEDSLADYLYDFPERYHHVSNKMVF